VRNKRYLTGLVTASLALCLPLLVACSSASDQQRLDPTPKPYVETDLDRKVEAATRLYNDCMTREGWIPQEVPALNDADKTGLGYSYTDEQAPQFQASSATCVDESGMASVVPPLTEADMREGYKSVLNMRECLRLEGFDMPQAPSLQSYLDADASWTPYDYVSLDRFQDAERACPQNGF
jgi:hypothetical protein